MEYISLNNGVKVPMIGFGTYKAKKGDSTSIIEDAIKVGYRLFDTAAFYDTEEILAKALEIQKLKEKKSLLQQNFGRKIWAMIIQLRPLINHFLI